MEQKKNLKELYSQDFIKLQSENDIEIINLDSVTSFSELRNKMGQITCEGKVSGLRFELKDTIYNITGFSDCPSSRVIGCYFRRNLLYVRNDSLLIENGKSKKRKPIAFLKTELNEIMSKTYNFQHNEDKLKPALIHFYVEDKYPIETTKRALKEIARQFKEINSQNDSDYFKYKILFEGFDITNIPPPPPPPEPNEFDNGKK
ncbi:hypothetical protein [Joostella sp. CR20]|uniref:hypothetical protein n=1 Tax=Joostella sp. CR20 TaxID=2804312 RepID=UPI00313BE106